MNQLNNISTPKGRKVFSRRMLFFSFFYFSSHCFGSGACALVMQTQMGAEFPNLYIANLPKEQQESKDFVRCICLDNNQKRGRAELLQKNWKTILYLLDEAQFVDADAPPKLDLLQAQAPEEVIKSIIRPEIEEGQVLQKKKMWMEMEGK